MQNIFILTTLIATSAAWVVPTYVVREASTITYMYTNADADISPMSIDTFKYTQTDTITLSITAAPADATPITTTTYAYDDLTMEDIELAAADLPTPLPTAPYDSAASLVSHIYVQKETISNPASCSNVEPWSYSTQITVYIPSEATYQLKPTSESTSIYTGYYRKEVMTEIYHFLAPSTVPTTTSSYYNYYGSSETDSCEIPYQVRYNFDDDDDDDDYSGSTSGSSSTWDDWLYERDQYRGKMKTYILIIAIVIPSIFVLGFVESYFWFTKLMKGRSALRGGTAMWVLISLWAACLIRSENAGADPKWREEAEAAWKARGMGEKLKLWLKYGFRWSYPVAVMGERNLPAKYVPGAEMVAVVTGQTKTGETGSIETGETAGTREGTREGTRDVPSTAPYVDASKSPV